MQNELAEAQSELLSLREQLRNSRLKGKVLAMSPTRSNRLPESASTSRARSFVQPFSYQVSNKTEEHIVSPRKHLDLEIPSSPSYTQQRPTRNSTNYISHKDVNQIRNNYLDDKRRYEREILQLKMNANAQMEEVIKRCEIERDTAIEQERSEAAMRLSDEVSEVQRTISAKAAADLKVELKRVKQALNKRHENEISKLKENYSREINAIKTKLTQELANAENIMDRMRKSNIQETNEEIERVTDKLTTKHEEEMKMKENTVKEEMDRLQSLKNREVQEMIASHLTEKNRMLMEKNDCVRSYESKIRELNRFHEIETQKIEGEVHEKLEAVKAAQDQKLVSVKAAAESKAVAEQQTITQYFEEEIKKLKDRHKHTVEQVKEEVKKNCENDFEIKYIGITQELKNQITTLSADLDLWKRRYNNLEKETSSNHQDEVERLKSQFTKETNSLIVKHNGQLQHLRDEIRRQAETRALNEDDRKLQYTSEVSCRKYKIKFEIR